MHQWIYNKTSKKYRGGKKLVKKAINTEIINSIEKFIKEIKKKYNVEAIILFGSYAKGTESEDSDIDIAIVSADFDDIYDCMAILMGMTWDIDARIEPHPIKKKDFDEVSDYFVKEIIDTGIKVA